MTKSEIVNLYDRLGTQEKRTVGKLVRALSEKEDMSAICRAVHRKSPAVRRQPSSYILFYKANYARIRQEHPGSSLGGIAKLVAEEWKSLSTERKAEFISTQSTSSVHDQCVERT